MDAQKIKEICTMPRMYYLPATQKNNNCEGLLKMLLDIAKPDFVMAEIGSFGGVSSMLFAEMTALVYCIDKWEEYQELSEEKLSIAEVMFDTNRKGYANMIKVKNDSVKASTLFADGSLDLVYIDGGHDHDSVVNDIKAYLPKIKKGGWITGHDIDIDVRIAVEEVLGTNYRTYPDSSWAIQVS